MPTWLKVILIILVVGVLLFAGVAGTGYYLWKKHGPGLVANVEQGTKDGRDFGAQTDNQGCVDEGVSRHRGAAGFTDLMKSGIFLRSCLEASRPTPNFCDAVPGPLEFTKTIQWRKAQCAKYGMTEAQQCGQFFQQVQQYCSAHVSDREKQGQETPDQP